LTTAAQIKGPTIQEWGDEGTLADINDVAVKEGWDDLLPSVVSSVMKYDGKYVAAPVNVHRVNWMWSNPEVFKKAGATLPTTWDEFFIAADKIKAAGMTAVAHGGQPWQDLTVFESVALGCHAAPGTVNAFTFNIDSFAMFKQNSDDAKSGQAKLASAIMDPKFQEVFNLNKGSIPARLGMSMDNFDDCAKLSSVNFSSNAKSGTLVPSMAHGMATFSSVSGAMSDAVTEFFNSDSISAKEAADKMAKAVKAAM